ncbi:hypothetical protein [Sphingobium abikonense]|uniref:hypothetical protein n=1 Tax=Sphingobium abikonense TaxID=86193 RepID=UPI0035177241
MPPGWSDYLRWRAAFAAILDPRFYTIEWLDGEVWSGRIRLFSSEKSAILCALKPYPTGAIVLEGMAAAGELSDIKPTIAIAEEWGRSIGCVCAEIASRPGWAKVMREDGYDIHQIAIRKAL